MNKRTRLFLGLGGIAVLCVGGALLALRSANQPVVSCGNALEKPLTTPPAALASAQVYFAQGDYDYEHGNCDKAIADYSISIEKDPTRAEAYNNRAYVYMVKRDYAAALSDLDRAIQLRPDYVNALMNRGDIHNYYYLIDFQRAVADYDRVLNADPSAPGYTSVCGHRLLALNQGWSLNVLATLVADGPTAGCPGAVH